MTKVLFSRDSKGLITGFRVSGHSGLSTEGSDILCAAVSAMSQLVTNTLTEELSVKAQIQVDEEKALLAVKLLSVPSEQETAVQALLSGFYREISGLNEAYPHNLSLRENQA